MNQNDRIEIARQAALNCTERHAYLPATPDDARTWQPHAWVLDAIAEAERRAQQPKPKSQMTLGALIDTLEQMSPDAKVALLRFPEVGQGRLIFEFAQGERRADMLLASCRLCLGKEFLVGADWLSVTLRTPVWVRVRQCCTRLMALNEDGTIETQED